jgi:hypothetical protein
LDLSVISEHHGRDFIPYPFMLTRQSGFTPETFEMHARQVVDRFENGDLRCIRRWAGSYVRADIRVEGHVQYIPSDTPSVRLVAHRLGELGFVARQLADSDVIEIFSLSPYDLGPVVAQAMALHKPGESRAIEIPEYARKRPDPVDGEVSVRAQPIDDDVSKVARTDVSAFGTVQTHWRPARRWGVDRGKDAVVYVRVKDDGDYAYSPDYSIAQPITTVQLTDRINRLIADDVALLRQFRRGK